MNFALEMKILGIDIGGFFWMLCQGILNIIYWLEQAFDFLIGADDVAGTGNLLVSIFNGEEGKVSVTQIYFAILLMCLLIMGICTAIGAIKSQFTKGATDSLSQMGEKTLFAILKMIFIPVVFMVALGATGSIFNYIIGIMGETTKSDSLAQILCNACNNSGREILFTQGYGDNDAISTDFDFVLCLLAGCCLLVTLVTVTINLVKRIIEVFFYYLTAPVALARTPLDDGKSFDLWKENVISKLLSAGGIIICMYLYFSLVPTFTRLVENWAGIQEVGGKVDKQGLAPILKILFVVGGSFVPANASMMLAQLISQGAGQNESSNLMHTQQMLNSGLNLAGKAAFAGMGAAGAAIFGKNRGAGAGASTRLRDGNGGGSDTSSPMRTGYEERGGAGGGSDALTNGGGNGGGTTPPTPAGGGAARTGYFSKVGGEVKNAFQSAGRAWNNPSQIQGFFGKVGAGIAAAGALAAGIALAPVKPLIKKGASAAGHGISKGASKVGGAIGGAAKKGWTAIRGGEERIAGRKTRRENNAAVKAEKKEFSEWQRSVKAEDKAYVDTSTFSGAVNVDTENKISSNTEAFLAAKEQKLMKKHTDTETFLSTHKDAQQWSDEQKAQYRAARYGREAAEYMGYRSRLQNVNLSEQRRNRYNNIFDKLQSKLPAGFGEGNNAGKGGDA